MPTQTIKRTMEQRRALIAECRRRMEAGEEIKSICAALQIPRGTFYKWSKIHGFRRGDIDPDDPRARIRVAPGPSDGTSSGRYMRGEGLGRPRSGGRQSLLTEEEQTHFADNLNLAWLVAQRAKAMGERDRCAAIFRAATGQTLTDSNFLSLRDKAMSDPSYDWGAFQHECMAQQSDEEAFARFAFGLAYGERKEHAEPPDDKRPAQAWIDYYHTLFQTKSHQELLEIGRTDIPPPHTPYSGCHAAANMALNPLGVIPYEDDAARE